MGRLSRHRKIKACDPFFKGKRSVDESSNAPVQPSQLDTQPCPRKSRRLVAEFPPRKPRGHKGRSTKEITKNKDKLNVERRPGETQREYYQRLDKQAAEHVNKILVKENRISQKRKQFLKARKEKASKKRKREMQEDEYKEFATDKVKFGEVVNEPPNFTSKPKNSGAADMNTKNKTESLLLQNKLNGQTRQDVQSKVVQTLPKAKKRKKMNPFEKQISDKRREEAIAAYRKMRKQNMAEN
ncbi:coiled-coil domain-containing protein 137-like [Dendronephthya gigantea]|uniref:coiled-coil domain-containing protein 137-like n=1 Tax=Dendronephthya gigantea TaxID=151771 RepID=UPI00106C00E7|nr:coiled-coil domain-containing protein 137-like [Dendronephthya gigantea]